MRRPNKKKYTIIALIIVGVMILSPVLSLVISAMAPTTEENIGENTSERDIADQVDNETALKIIDIHQNMDSYKGEEISMDLQFFLIEENEDNLFSLGSVDTVDNGEEMLFNMYAKTKDGSIPEGFENYDTVKVTGTIDSFEEGHEEHTHEVPIIIVKSIEKIEKIENQDN